MSKDPTQTGTNTTTTTNAPPQYVQDAQQALLAFGLNLDAPFLAQSPQYAIAGFTPDQTMAFDLARNQAQQAFSVDPLQVNQFGSTTAVPASAVAMPSLGAAAAATPGVASAGQATAVQAGPAAQAQAALAKAILNNGNASQADLATALAAQLAPGEISPFLDPYTTDVVNTTQQQLSEANDKAQAAIRARQAAEGAYGGNRGALQASEQNRNYGNTLASTVAGLYNTGWNKAADLASTNAAMRQQTELANQQAANQIGMFNVGAKNQFSLADQQYANAVALANAGAQNQVGMFNAGATNQISLANMQAANAVALANANAQTQASMANAQGQTQASIASMQGQNQLTGLAGQLQMQGALANAANQQQANMWNAQAPLQNAAMQNTLNQTSWQQQMQALQALLGTGQTQQQLAQQAINVPWTALSNLASIVPSAYGNTGQSSQPIYGPSTFQSVLSALPLGIAAAGAASNAGLFSDRTMKKDMEKMGKDPATNLDMYKYRFKGAPPDSPKHMGPMAQDVEKKFPGSTMRVGGKMAIKGSARQLLGI